MSVVLDKDNEAGRNTRPASVRVWDPFVRIFHWALVAAFATAWLSAEESGRLHRMAGYFIIALLAVRVVLGFLGSRHARFGDFIYRPSTVLGYLRGVLMLKAPRYLGHNPAGGVMVILMLLTLAAITGSGYMMTTDAFWGLRWVREIHETAVNVMLLLILLHLVGVGVASFEHRENLVKSMITGWKRRLDGG